MDGVNTKVNYRAVTRISAPARLICVESENATRPRYRLATVSVLPAADELEVIQLQLGMSFARDKERRAQENGADKRADRDVRPRRKRDPHGQCRQQDRSVCDEIISRAEPHRPHVDVLRTVAPEQGKADAVRGQRKSSLSHPSSQTPGAEGKAACPRAAQRRKARKKPHHRCLRKRGARVPDGTARDDVKTKAINKRVAEHVERVGEQRHGPSEQARHKFDDKHRSVH